MDSTTTKNSSLDDIQTHLEAAKDINWSASDFVQVHARAIEESIEIFEDLCQVLEIYCPVDCPDLQRHGNKRCPTCLGNHAKKVRVKWSIT